MEDIHILYRQRDELTQLLDEVESSSNAILDISPEEDIRLDMIQQEYRELRKELNSRIKDLRGYDTSSKASRKTRKSVSYASVKSNRSLKTEEEAKAAAIQVQLKYHQAETEMIKMKIEKEAEMEAAATRMKLEKELDIAKARLQVFKEEEEMSQELGSDGSSDKEDSQVKVRRFLESLPEQPEMLQNTATTTAAVATTNLASSGFQTIVSYPAPIISDTTTVPCTLSMNEQTSGFPRASYETPLVRDQRGLNPYAPPFSAASMNTPDEHRIGYQPPIMSTGFTPNVTSANQSKVRLPYGFESVYQHMYPSAEPTFCDSSNPLGRNNEETKEMEPQSKKTLSDTTTQPGLETMVKLMRKPTPDIDKFDGNAILYRRFVRQFNNYVSSFCENDHERLTYLEQFTTGEAHRVVMGYSNLGSSAGYAAAMHELDERYGNEENIASAYVQKALNWPIIKISDVKALDEYSIFLRECLHAIEEVGALGVLEYQGNLKAMVERLPFKLHDRWRSIVVSKKSAGIRVRFVDLVDFVSLEAKKARDPVYGRDVLKASTDTDGTTKAKKQKNPPTKSRCLATKIETENKKVSKEETDEASTSCLKCGGKHDIDVCDEFLKATLENKQAFAKSKGICFGCLERAGHLNKNCKNRKQCRTCDKRHPTAFHEFYTTKRPQRTGENNEIKVNKENEETVPKEIDSTVSFCINGAKETMTSMTVPVYVSHESNPEREELVYALLDTQSETSHITNKSL